MNTMPIRMLAACAVALAAVAPIAAALAQPQQQPQPSALPGMDAVGDLARLNGQALACRDLQAAGRAKALMIAHAPKTAEYATVYDQGTQASYLALARSQGECPDAATLGARLDAVARRLQAALPAGR